MMFFLDTGNTKEIKEAASWGVLDGITTNPSLVAKEGRSFKDLLKEICTIVDGPISAEVVSIETLCFSPTQAMLAAKAGAWCVSPFIGRLDDISENGMELIRDIVTIYRNYQYKTKVLVASVRNPMHVVDAAKIGGDICTMPFTVFKQLVQHPLTDLGLKKFLADWEKQNVPKG